MKIRTLLATLAILTLTSARTFAINDSVPLFSTLRMEVRADFEYHHLMTSSSVRPLVHNDNTYG